MGAGVLAVKQKLISAFDAVDFRERFDGAADSTVLTFESDGQIYSVRVSKEFDDDFLSGTTVSLRDLITVLKRSPDRKALVGNPEITEG
jgi:hypothetical protein